MIYEKIYAILLQKLAELMGSKIPGLALNLSKTGGTNIAKINFNWWIT